MEVESGTVDVFPVLVPVELLPLKEVPLLPLLELPLLVEVPPPPPLLEEVPPDLPVLLLPPPLLPPPPPPLRRSKRLEFEWLVMNGMNIVESHEGCDTGEKGGQETQTAFMSVSDCYGIRAPTRYTLHFPLPRQTTLLLYQRLSRFTGPTSRSIRIHPRLLILLTEPRSDIRCVFLFHLFLPLIRSALPLDLRPTGLHLVPRMFSSLRFRSCSTFATQHRPSVPLPLSTSYDSSLISPIGSAKW